MGISLETRFCMCLNPCMVSKPCLLKQHITGEEAIPASWVSLMKDDAI